MDILTILLIAVGLAMDAFAVSIASGLTVKGLQLKGALKIALFFGLFQALMPVLGWSAGLGLRGFISGIDHWIAFGILSVIGSKMIFESFAIKTNRGKTENQGTYTLLVLSIATSIDALAVGLTLSFLKVSIFSPAIIIGVVTAILSFAGVLIGKRYGHLFESKIEALAGLILIGIGIKILIEHLS